jgi:carboxymethylenebutenolidase
MTGKDITIKAHDGGSFSAYLASPKSGKGPAIVVIQEIFGVNQGMRKICDDYAAQGYFAISPDIFWRQEPGVQLTDKTEAEWGKAFQFYQGFDVANGISDLKSTLAYVRHIPGSNGKAGVTGYCLGGKLTYLMACQSDSDASAAYYGGGIQEILDEAKTLKKPLMLHFAEEDEYINKAAQQNIHQALGSNPLINLYFYPKVNHAFARPNGQHYDQAAAELANKRTADFFKKCLG